MGKEADRLLRRMAERMSIKEKNLFHPIYKQYNIIKQQSHNYFQFSHAMFTML